MATRSPWFDRSPPPKADEPPLHRAARTGDCAELRRLVAAGERLEATFNTELDPGAFERLATPFMVAAGSSDGASVETLRALLELGADPRAVIAGRSAATFACHGLACWHKPGGDAERLRFVLHAGSPLPADPVEANRLLCDTAEAGDAARVRILLDHGLSASGHWDPAKSREGFRGITDELGPSRAVLPEGLASAPEALRETFTAMMRLFEHSLVEQMGSAPCDSEIPLFCAAKSGNAECVRVLLAAGADPKARDNAQRTAMYYAESAEVVRALMLAGVPLEDADMFGCSPIADALNDERNAVARVRALIDAGANVNATHDRGYTVFMSAVGSGRCPAVLRLLVASGADPHAVTEIGYNAFHAAIDVNGEANAEESVRDTLAYLRELGVNIEHRNANNQTPLALAIDAGTALEVRVLCELGADPNAVCAKRECGEDSCTHVELPLLFHAAVDAGDQNDAKTEALLRAGANPLAQDAEGHTPLMRAADALCRDATGHGSRYEAFFEGLNELGLDARPMPPARDDFIAEVTPLLRTYVERFAREIPATGPSERDAERRSERIACVVSLCAYECWARHELRNARKP